MKGPTAQPHQSSAMQAPQLWKLHPNLYPDWGGTARLGGKL
jgi:hypothetical protein